VSSAYHSQYVFWDYVHPTTAAHAVLADTAVWLVPESGTLVMALMAAAMWLVRGVAKRKGRSS
jgi:phospholipase/lecithinase/hemolysin